MGAVKGRLAEMIDTFQQACVEGAKPCRHYAAEATMGLYKEVLLGEMDPPTRPNPGAYTNYMFMGRPILLDDAVPRGTILMVREDQIAPVDVMLADPSVARVDLRKKRREKFSG